MNTTSDEMNLWIYLVQHVDDLRRHEPRNVGVIVTDQERVAYALVDPAEKRLPARQRAVAETVACDETYPEWLAYWRRVLQEGIAGLEEIVSRQSPTFPVIMAGKVTGDIGETLNELVARYYDELVLPPPESRDSTAERPVERMFRLAGVNSSPHFRRKYTVNSVGLKLALPIEFPYAWVNGHVAVADQILHHTGDNKLTASLWKFEHVSDDVSRIAIVDQNIDYRSEPLRELLSATARVIRVDDPAAASQLRDAFGI
jgi:hypothetical protein